MTETYYFDTCIWRDFYESRTGLRGKPLGKYAAELFMKVIARKDLLLFSELIIRELKIEYNDKEITDMLNFLFQTRILEKIDIEAADCIEAERITAQRNIPPNDALHAVISRRNHAIFVSQDEHAQHLKDIVTVKKPEEIT